VAVSPDGTILAADALRPAVWRISPDGASMKEMTYPNEIVLPPGAHRYASVSVEPDGGFVLLIGGWDYAVGAVAQFYRFAPGGEVKEIPLHGPRTRRPVALTPGGSGNYFFANEEFSGPSGGTPILRLTATGAVSNFAEMRVLPPVRMVRDPETGNLVVSDSDPARLLFLRPEDGSVVATVSFEGLACPVALVWDPHN